MAIGARVYYFLCVMCVQIYELAMFGHSTINWSTSEHLICIHMNYLYGKNGKRVIQVVKHTYLLDTFINICTMSIYIDY